MRKPMIRRGAAVILSMVLSAGMLSPVFADSANMVTAKAEDSQTVQTDKDEIFNQTLFLTDAGNTAFTEVSVPSDSYYIVKAYGTAGDVSIVLRDSEGNVQDIADEVVQTKNTSGQKVYVTAASWKMKAGTWSIGVSAPRVSKIHLTVTKMPELKTGVASTGSFQEGDTLIGGTFTPSKSGAYTFYENDKRSSVSLRVLDEDGTVLKSTSKESWISDFSSYGRKLSCSLEAGKTYRLLAAGGNDNNSSDHAAWSITVQPRISTNGTELENGQAVEKHSDQYSDVHYFRFTPEESGLYYFNAAGNLYNINFSLFDSGEKKIGKADIHYTSTDNYENYPLQCDMTTELTAGKTYYIAANVSGGHRSDFRFRVQKLQPVKRLTITHKPNQKQFVEGLNETINRKGLIINAQLSDGKSVRLDLSDTNQGKTLYRQGCPVTTSEKTSGENRVLTVRYRGKTVKVKVPIVTVDEKYQKVKSITDSTAFTTKTNAWHFVRFTPSKSGLYGVTVSSGKTGQRLYIFDSFGEFLTKKAALYHKENGRTVYKGTAAVSMTKGETYYIGTKAMYSNGPVTLRVHYDVPKAPTGVKVTKTSGNAVTMKWKKLKNAYGYQIRYRVGKGNWKTLGTRYASNNDIDGLKKGKTYTFQVRAYRKAMTKNYYGEYSRPVYVKM